MSGVAMQRSKSICPACTFSARSSAPTMSAPAAFASSARGALGEDGDAQRLAGAVRQHHRAAQILLRLARVEVEVERDLDGLVELGGGAALDHLHRRSAAGRTGCGRCRPPPCVMRLPLLAMALLHHLEAHGAGGARDHAAGAVDVLGVQILHLLLRRSRGSAPSSPCPPCPCRASASPSRCRPPSSGNRSWAATSSRR